MRAAFVSAPRSCTFMYTPVGASATVARLTRDGTFGNILYKEDMIIKMQTDRSERPSSGGDDGEQLVKLCASLLEDDEFIARYVLKSEKVERAVIDRYLRGRTKSAPIMPQGSAVLAPLKKAKDLDEARRLCEQFLRNV